MKEITGNLWDFYDKGVAICITTNGFVKKNGEAVMGRGCALEAAKRFPDLPKQVGKLLQSVGLRTMWHPNYKLFTFPVKYRWNYPADLDLIKKSCGMLIAVMDGLKINRVILPRPGCGNGRLDWETVKKEIEPLLDDRVEVITWDK